MTDKEKDLSIEDILGILRESRVVIILLAVLAAFAVFIETYCFEKDTFTANGILYISNRNQENAVQVIQKGDIDSSRSLSTTYIELLKTDSFLEAVSAKLPFDCSWKRISSILSVSVVNETELIRISVTSDTSYEAYCVTQEILNQAPAMLADIFEGGEIKVVNPPRIPSAPNSKGIIKKSLLALFVGAFLGCIYAFIKSFLDKNVHSGNEISKHYGISLLGETARPSGSRRHIRKNKYHMTDDFENVLNDDTDFDTVETYKSIRTNIMFSMPKQDNAKVIAVTSSIPGEGKTTTAINLAITFAQTGAKILLIDCDLRRSRVHRYLQIEKKDGVSNVVCGYTLLENAIQQNIRPNLDCITAGENPPNPAELLQTEEFKNMISVLQSQYDYIFIDTPPITVVTDATVVTKVCTGVIVVARSEMTTYDLLDPAIKELKNAGSQIIGTIVHDSSEKQKKYGYYKSKYGSKYAYKYAYRYGDNEKKW